MPKHPNYRLVKTHRNYTVEDLARLFNIHKNSVRIWVKAGLPVCDEKRPLLILGADLSQFLKDRRTKNKRTCGPGEIYCVACRHPKSPAGGMADYIPISDNLGALSAICPDCDSMINRRVSLAKVPFIQGNIEITFPQALDRVSDSPLPSVNVDFR